MNSELVEMLAYAERAGDLRTIKETLDIAMTGGDAPAILRGRARYDREIGRNPRPPDLPGDMMPGIMAEQIAGRARQTAREATAQRGKRRR